MWEDYLKLCYLYVFKEVFFNYWIIGENVGEEGWVLVERRGFKI